jgi:phosphoribosylformylglycinamidine (FGAM) synthase-like enzyme
LSELRFARTAGSDVVVFRSHRWHGRSLRAFNTPVVSGNVSFYNETEGRGILPTPVIGMIGLVEDVRRAVQPGFKKKATLIALLGTTQTIFR